MTSGHGRVGNASMTRHLPQLPFTPDGVIAAPNDVEEDVLVFGLSGLRNCLSRVSCRAFACALLVQSSARRCNQTRMAWP